MGIVIWKTAAVPLSLLLIGAARIEDARISPARWWQCGCMETRARHANRPSLIETVAALDKPGSMPVSAAFAFRDGQMVACVTIVKSINAVTTFCEITRPVLAPGGPGVERADLTEPAIQALRIQSRIVERSGLCLVEAISFAECVSDGQVHSITPIEHGGSPAFHVIIGRRDAKPLRAYLDPATGELAQIVTR